MNRIYTLDNAKTGETVIIQSLLSKGGIRRRLQDIGLTDDTTVECVGRSPLGDPIAFLIRGAVIAIRTEDCKNILVRRPEEKKQWD